MNRIRKLIIATVWVLATFDAVYIFGTLFAIAKEFLRFNEFPIGAIGVKTENVILFFIYNLLLIILSEIYSPWGKWQIRVLVLLGVIIFLSGAVAFL